MADDEEKIDQLPGDSAGLHDGAHDDDADVGAAAWMSTTRVTSSTYPQMFRQQMEAAPYQTAANVYEQQQMMRGAFNEQMYQMPHLRCDDLWARSAVHAAIHAACTISGASRRTRSSSTSTGQLGAVRWQ